MPCKTLCLLFILQITLFPVLFSQTNEQFRANLYGYEADGKAYLDDGNLTMYNAANSNTVDNMDALKMSNFGENFGLKRGVTTLVIERRKSIITSDTTFFKMWNMRQKTYIIELQLTGLDHPGLIAVLEDMYLNTKTSLELDGTTSTAFTITSIAASAAPDRFRIIFSSTSSTAYVLPVTFRNFSALQKSSNIVVEWTVENNKEVANYEVQRSYDGQHFTTAAAFASTVSNTAIYKWTDNALDAGNKYYRIKSVDINNKAAYSNIIKVSAETLAESILVYPNPVINGVINLKLHSLPQGIYSVRLFNNAGQVVYFTQVKHNAESSQQTIHLNKNIVKGNYQLELTSPDKFKINTKIFVQ